MQVQTLIWYLVLVDRQNALERMRKQLAEGCDDKGLWIQRRRQLVFKHLLLSSTVQYMLMLQHQTWQEA